MVKEHKTGKWDLNSQSKALIRRRKKFIAKTLDKVPYGSSVFTIPCGTGWLLPLLKRQRYKIVAGNPSIEEVAMTKHSMGEYGENCIDRADSFYIVDIYSTNFKDNCFDAVILNLDFCNLEKPESRHYVLREFHRICSGPIIIPLVFNTRINVMTFVFKNLIPRRQSNYTISEDFGIIVEDVRKADLFIERLIPIQPFFSKQWYMVLRRLPKNND